MRLDECMFFDSGDPHSSRMRANQVAMNLGIVFLSPKVS